MDFRPLTLRGSHVELVPLTLAHADELFSVTPPDTFAMFLSWPERWDSRAFNEFLARHLSSPRQVSFAVRRLDTGAICGSSSYLDIDPKNRSVEIGATWYAADARGTRINPECKLLMLRHAFEEQRVVRVTLKCNLANLHSQAAIAKLGAVREGVLRKHRIKQDGSTRDTVMYGITDDEWPVVEARLERRIG